MSTARMNQAEQGSGPLGSRAGRKRETSCRCREECGCKTIGHAWIIGEVATDAGPIFKVSSDLSPADRLGSWKARWGIGRMQFRVPPGLYAVGQPTSASPVLVSANYKMSFDRLRSNLSGLDAWVLVLDTQGVNVWCSAGKVTFCVDEVVRRLEEVKLARVVSHRKLILPQLAAAGVAAHEVRRQCGFQVVFGPVRAEDIPAFLTAGMTATEEMRRVQFPLSDRLALVPIELVLSARKVFLLAACLFLLSGWGTDGYSAARATGRGLVNSLLFVGSCWASLLLGPALLPWLPGRAFSVKGAWVGLVLVMVGFGLGWLWPGLYGNRVTAVAWCLMTLSVSSFAVLNFTGASTFTSPSGARREMRIAVPTQAALGAVGLALWLAGRFFP